MRMECMHFHVFFRMNDVKMRSKSLRRLDPLETLPLKTVILWKAYLYMRGCQSLASVRLEAANL